MHKERRKKKKKKKREKEKNHTTQVINKEAYTEGLIQ